MPMSDDYAADIIEGLGAPQKKPLWSYGKTAEFRNEVRKRTWNRLREYGPADLRAMMPAVEDRIEVIERQIRWRKKDGKDVGALTRMRLQRALELQVMESLIIHHFERGRPSEWEEIDYTRPPVRTQGPKEQEIQECIQRLISSGDYPEHKTNFYAEVDKMRGLSPSGRATENWLRNNRPESYLSPEEWEAEFGM